MTRVIETTVYQFDELSDKAKERARDWCRGWICDDWQPNYTEFKDVAERLGVEFKDETYHVTGRAGVFRRPDINYSVGDGRSDFCTFSGYWEYNIQATSLVREYASLDTDLHDIADELQRAWTMARLAGAEELRARMRACSRGYGSYTMDVEVESDLDDGEDGTPEPVATTVGEQMKAFAGWMLKRMQEEYEYQYSDENVDETIRANEYEFDEDGRRV
jgi:hypothetical protein